MAAAHEGLEYKSLQAPGGLTSAYISKDSGTLPTALTKRDPRGNRIYSEIFISGTQPTTLDNIHVELDVVKAADGKYYLPSDKTPKDKIQKVVFITRDTRLYSGNMLDNKYLAPVAKDPTEYKVEEKDKDKDKDKDKNKDKIPNPNKPGENTNPGDTTTPPVGPSDPGGDTGDEGNEGNTGNSENKPEAFNHLLNIYTMIPKIFSNSIRG